jgi:hypothetical protein
MGRRDQLILMVDPNQDFIVFGFPTFQVDNGLIEQSQFSNCVYGVEYGTLGLIGKYALGMLGQFRRKANNI